MSLQGEYIYGIVEEPQHRKFSFPGVGNADVYTINHEQMAAVVSDTEFSEIDPTRKNVQAHTIVQEALLEEYCLLPMGFGMVATGEDEVRAWSIRKGSSAVEAAGKIHTDLARGFIRAETVAYDDLVAAGDMKSAKVAGKIRQEGKTYVVQDGDVINIKFNL